jgi:4-amino-4-deoxy-L-arabinose transferase-like glycosyltransferase
MMRDNTLDFIAQFLKYALLIGASLFVITYLIIAFLRIRFPFELVIFEGGVMEHVRRIISGQRIYVGPSWEFAPFLYPPFYYYVLAVIAKAFGLCLVPLRLFSFLLSLANFLLIFIFVKKESKNIFAAFLACCLFAATFRIGNLIFDVIKNDTLFLLLLLSALYLLKFRSSHWPRLLSGALIALAYLTKQTTLVIIAPILAYPFIVRIKYAFLFAATVIITIVGSSLFLDYLNHGWYNYYVFYLASSLGIIKRQAILFLGERLLLSLSIAFVTSIFYICAQMVKPKNKNAVFYPLLCISAIGGSLIATLYRGTSSNSFLPAYAVLSILFGLGISQMLEMISTIALLKTRKMLEVWLYTCCILQFVCLVYNPFTVIPTAEHLKANKSYLKSLREIKGEVFLPWHGYLATLAGKNNSLHIYPLHDIIVKNQKGVVREQLIRDIRQAIREKRFAAIISEEDWFFQKDTQEYYTPKGLVFKQEVMLCPLADKINPVIYVPKK